MSRPTDWWPARASSLACSKAASATFTQARRSGAKARSSVGDDHQTAARRVARKPAVSADCPRRPTRGDAPRACAPCTAQTYFFLTASSRREK
eukprot:6063059-Prymnesium_polylepis.1